MLSLTHAELASSSCVKFICGRIYATEPLFLLMHLELIEVGGWSTIFYVIFCLVVATGMSGKDLIPYLDGAPDSTC